MRRFAVVGLVAVFIGCSSSGTDDGGGAAAKGPQVGAGGGAGSTHTNAGTGSELTTDAGAGGSAGTPDSAGAGGVGQCIGELSDLGKWCSPTFDGSAEEAAAASCTLYSDGACDGLLWVLAGGLGGRVCAYDPTTHELVGAQEYDDVPDFCNHTSFEQHAGLVPSDACIAQNHDCGDLSVAGAAP